MNDGVLVVNFAALDQAGADIGSALGKLGADLDELKQIGDKLMATWDGQAQAAYLIQQTKWSDAAEHLSIILRDIQKALLESSQEYMSTEKKATSLFQ
jgi:early secretory antigenic target protein ESAT-6